MGQGFQRPGPQCSVCEHPEARNIATALLAGASVRDVAQRYGLTKSTVARHHRLHLLPKLTPAESAPPAQLQAIEDHGISQTVLGAVHDLHRRTLALLTQAEAASDRPSAARLIGEARRNLELVGRLTGELDGPTAPQSGSVNVVITYVDRQVVLPGAPPMLESGEGE